MAVSIQIVNLPVDPDIATPILRNSNEVGNYGTTAADVIVEGAQPDIQNNPSRSSFQFGEVFRLSVVLILERGAACRPM